MEIQQLKSFIAVAKYGTFSRAAKMIHRTQPAISLQVKGLEQEFDVKLFDRLNPRKIALTAHGKTLLDLASPIMNDIGSLQSRFNEMIGSADKGRVRIGTHTSVIVHLLPDIVKKFKKKFPDCDLVISNSNRMEMLTMLKNGDIDIGITWLADIPGNIDYKVFAKFERLLIAAKGHPLSKKRDITLKDISKYPLILPPKWSHARAMINHEFEQKKLKYKVTMEIAEKAAVKTYVKMGLGIAIIDGFYLDEEDKEKLFSKKTGKYFGEAECGVLTLKNKYQPHHVTEFINKTRGI